MSDDGWKVRHGNDVQPIGENFAVELGTRREVQPSDLILGILVFSPVRQIFLEKVQFPHDRSAGRAVDGGVLRADGDADSFARECLRDTKGQCEKESRDFHQEWEI